MLKMNSGEYASWLLHMDFVTLRWTQSFPVSSHAPTALSAHTQTTNIRFPLALRSMVSLFYPWNSLLLVTYVYVRNKLIFQRLPQTLKLNVDLLRIIQLGLTFADEQGNLADPCCWQFHFKFNLTEDTFAQDSIDLLTTAGINFEKHQSDGIDALEFGALLITSGLVMREEVRWISFHSYYDFGYLIKLLTHEDMPIHESEFFEILRLYFPCIYDIKYLMKSCETLKGGLNKVAEALQVRRIGPTHQAGSDSLVTCLTFFKMRRGFFDGVIDDNKYLGVLYGLGQGGQSAPIPWNE